MINVTGTNLIALFDEPAAALCPRQDVFRKGLDQLADVTDFPDEQTGPATDLQQLVEHKAGNTGMQIDLGRGKPRSLCSVEIKGLGGHERDVAARRDD